MMIIQQNLRIKLKHSKSKLETKRNKHDFRNISQKDMDTKTLKLEARESILPELLISDTNEKGYHLVRTMYHFCQVIYLTKTRNG